MITDEADQVFSDALSVYVWGHPVNRIFFRILSEQPLVMPNCTFPFDRRQRKTWSGGNVQYVICQPSVWSLDVQCTWIFHLQKREYLWKTWMKQCSLLVMGCHFPYLVLPVLHKSNQPQYWIIATVGVKGHSASSCQNIVTACHRQENGYKNLAWFL